MRSTGKGVGAFIFALAAAFVVMLPAGTFAQLAPPNLSPPALGCRLCPLPPAPTPTMWYFVPYGSDDGTKGPFSSWSACETARQSARVAGQCSTEKGRQK